MKRLCTLLLLFGQLSAWDQTPWMQELFQPELELHYQDLSAQRLNVDHRCLRHRLHAEQLGLLAAMRVLPRLDAALGLNFVRTACHSAGYQNGFLQARYLLMDDLVGDPLNLLIGLRLNLPGAWTASQKILTYHGPLEALLLIALGKELCGSDLWRSRCWLQGALGQATRGAPWIETEGWIEGEWSHHPCHRFSSRSQLGVLLDYGAGYGHHSLKPHSFHGYGRIHYRSSQLGCRYALIYDLTHQTLEIIYRYRFYARNYPARASSGSLSWSYRF